MVKSRNRAYLLTGMGFIIDAKDKTNNKLKIFEPNILPTTRSYSFFIAPVIEVANSGKLVPIDNKVRPIIKLLIL